VQFSSYCHFHKLSCSCLLRGAAAPASRHVCLQFTWEVGLPSSPVEFSSLRHSHKLSCFCLLGTRPCSRQRLSSQAGLFIYSPGKDSLPQSSALSAPTLFPACLYCSYCLLLSFSFFPWVEVSLSRGLCCSGPGLSVGVPHTVKLTWSASSQAISVMPTLNWSLCLV
jgi:hypothetical protein